MGPWYHPSAQETQPLFGEHKLAGDGAGWVKTQCCLADAWHGGGSLLLRGLIPPEVDNVAVRWVSDGWGVWASAFCPLSAAKLGRGVCRSQVGTEVLWSHTLYGASPAF